MGRTSSQVARWRIGSGRCRWMVMHEVHWSISPSVTLPWLTRFRPWWITLVKQPREDRPGVSSLIKNELNYSEPLYKMALPDSSLSIRFLQNLMHNKHCLLAHCFEERLLYSYYGREMKTARYIISATTAYRCLFVSGILCQNEAKHIDFEFYFKDSLQELVVLCSSTHPKEWMEGKPS